MFKKSNVPPVPKPTAFTTGQILSDITAIIRQEEVGEVANPFHVNHKESWYKELKEFTDVTNELVDTLEYGAVKRDDLLRIKKDLESDCNLIKNKAKEALECK